MAKEQPQKINPKIRPTKKKNKVLLAVYGAVLAVALIFGGFYFYKYQDLNAQYKDLTMSEEDKTRKVVGEVTKLYKIPSYEEEKPTQYVTFKDQKSLEELKKNTSFLKEANLNDVFLAYQKADSVILYRPSEKRIINTDKYSKVAAGTVKIALVAPTDQQTSAENTIKQKAANVTVVSKTAPKTNVTAGLVVDVSGKEPEAAKKIAELLGYTVGSLPQGETMPQNANFIVFAPSSTSPPTN